LRAAWAVGGGDAEYQAEFVFWFVYSAAVVPIAAGVYAVFWDIAADDRRGGDV